METSASQLQIAYPPLQVSEVTRRSVIQAIVLYWPQGTRFVYLRQAGQEDRVVIFIAALLPDSRHELHLTYDYRIFCPFGPFEEFFTLRVAGVRIFVERGARDEIESS